MNDDIERAVAQVSAIMDVEGFRATRQDRLGEFVDGLRRAISAEAMKISAEQKKIELEK